MSEWECESCMYWWDHGECHRHAPVIIHSPESDFYKEAIWPQTKKDDGCGDWVNAE